MEQPIIQLKDGEAVVFGYGSLLSIASLERTLKQRYDGSFVVCALNGWRRTWDVRQPNKTFYAATPDGRMYPENILYLNVTKDPGARLNGVAIVVTAAQLEWLDEREWMYDRVVITQEIEGARVIGGSAVIYVSKPEYVMRDVRSTRVAAVRATYLEIVEIGLRDLGAGFRNAYESSTDPVPQHLVIQDLRDD